MRLRNRKNKKVTTRRHKSSQRFPMWTGLTVLSFAVIVFAAGYLAQISATASKGYAIRSLQNEIIDLKEEKEKLEFQVAKERSMVAVEEKVSSLGLVPVSEIEYMTETDPLVAKR